jgi:hypothetical protein
MQKIANSQWWPKRRKDSSLKKDNISLAPREPTLNNLREEFQSEKEAVTIALSSGSGKNVPRFK